MLPLGSVDPIQDRLFFLDKERGYKPLIQQTV